MSADWPVTGAIPVFQGDEQAPELAGYTTMILEWYPKVSRFMMSKKGSAPGTMVFVGEAKVIERSAAGGSYLAWLVIAGDPRDLPEFWPI